MYKILLIAVMSLLTSCEDVTYFIVRHAEKEGSVMSGDPPLSAKGEKQALDLKYMLQGTKLNQIFSTNTKRTLSTALPVSAFFGIKVEHYDAKKVNEFVQRLKGIKDGNVLVVSHSNVVDDIVNGLLGEQKLSDLPEDEYGIMYKVSRNGSYFSLERFAITKVTPR